MDSDDVGVVESGCRSGLPLESFEALGIGSENLRQDFESNVAVQLGVERFIDITHAARAEGGFDRVGPEFRPRR